MKKYLSICFLLLMVSGSVYSQIRHIGGSKSIDLTAGISKYGQYYSGGYVMYFSSNLYGKGAVFYEDGEKGGLGFTSVGTDITLGYSPFNIREIVYFNVVSGLTFASDRLKDNEFFVLPNAFKSGVMAGMETEIFLSDRFVFIMNWNQRLLLNPNFGNYRWFAGAGLRFNL